MKKSLKNALLASAAIMGLAGATLAHASTKDGFYLTPNGEVIFVNSGFTKDNGTGVGGGGGLAIGYQIKKFQIELAANYQYYGGTGTVTQKAANIPGGALTTTVDSTEHFVPITLGLNYVIPVNASGSLALTPGIAGGVWIHNVNRTWKVTGAETLGAAAAGLAGAPTSDEATETKGVVVPSLTLDYAPTQNVTIRFAGKFYIVPGGYSDNYSTAARAAADAGKTSLGLTPAYNGKDQTFWYGGVNVGVQYTF